MKYLIGGIKQLTNLKHLALYLRDNNLKENEENM